jgi:HSP20 family protein
LIAPTIWRLTYELINNFRKREGMIHDPVMWAPIMDFYELANNYVLNAEVPGVERSDIKIQLSGSELIILGERRSEEVCAKEKYHRLEGHRGKFLRTFSLPEPVDGKRMQIKLEDGILNVVLPKISDRKKPQRSSR